MTAEASEITGQDVPSTVPETVIQEGRWDPSKDRRFPYITDYNGKRALNITAWTGFYEKEDARVLYVESTHHLVLLVDGHGTEVLAKIKDSLYLFDPTSIYDYLNAIKRTKSTTELFAEIAKFFKPDVDELLDDVKVVGSRILLQDFDITNAIEGNSNSGIANKVKKHIGITDSDWVTLMERIKTQLADELVKALDSAASALRSHPYYKSFKIGIGKDGETVVSGIYLDKLADIVAPDYAYAERLIWRKDGHLLSLANREDFSREIGIGLKEVDARRHVKSESIKTLWLYLLSSCDKVDIKGKRIGKVPVKNGILDIGSGELITNTRQGGTKAIGELTFIAKNASHVDTVIPKGTLCSQPNPNSAPVYFETLNEDVLTAGSLTVTINASALIEGENGNAPANTIIGLANVPNGIHAVTNSLAFHSGTNSESDEDLRRRYIYSVNVPGKATKGMIAQHLEELDSVSEAHVFTIVPAVVEIMVDTTSGIHNTDPLIEHTVTDQLAAGIISRGVIGATVVGGNLYYTNNVCAGGRIFAVADTFITQNEYLKVSYRNFNNAVRDTAILTIPAYSPVGSSWEFALQTSEDRCIEIIKIEHDVHGEQEAHGNYTINIGLGKYPYLFNLPLDVEANMTVLLTKTASPEANLFENIKSSLTECLNNYKIGQKIEYSDVAKHAYIDFATGRAFRGIERIYKIGIAAKDVIIDVYGEEITISNSERLRAGHILVTTPDDSTPQDQ